MCVTLYRLVTKSLKLDNRVLFGAAVLGTLTGVVLMGDWQAIGGDPCSSSDNMSPENGSGSGLCKNTSQLLCEAQSTSSQSCFWNPQSRITGEYCNTCHELCQSKQRAINFYQFSVGVLLVSLTSPLGFVYAAAITSDITSIESQVNYYSLDIVCYILLS